MKTGVAAIATGGTVDVNTDYVIAVSHNRSANVSKIFVNGVLVATGTGIAAAIQESNPGFGSRGNSSEYFSGIIYAVGSVDRTISDEELRVLSENPWRLFYKPNRAVYYSDAGSQGIAPSLLTNSNSFYTPSIAVGAVTVAPSLLTNSQSFPTHDISLAGASQGVTPGLLANANSFYAPDIGRGAVTVSPSLFSNANTFPTHIVSLSGGPQAITPDLYSNVNSFYTANIERGAVSISPSLLTNTSSFPLASVGIIGDQTISPPLIASMASIPAPTIGQPVYPEISVSYTPSLFPARGESLEGYLTEEFYQLAEVLEIIAKGHVEKVYAAPSNPYEGMMRLADGTYWNPDGSGGGVFCFYGSSWKRLG